MAKDDDDDKTTPAPHAPTPKDPSEVFMDLCKEWVRRELRFRARGLTEDECMEQNP